MNANLTAARCVLALTVLTGCGAGGPSAPPPDPTQVPDARNAEAVASWLAEGYYEAWHAEPAAHPSLGPHFGNVRTYVNEAAHTGLTGGTGVLPAGSVAVKVLYGATTDTPEGFAVSYKFASESAAGDGWYWYERFGPDLIMDEDGASNFCAECHAEPVNVDLIKTVF